MKYKSLNKDQLKELCMKRNLNGDAKTKNELINRLLDDDAKSETQIEFSDAPSINYKQSNNTFFIQLKAANVFHYFNSGVIYPLSLEESEIYKNENRKKDIFTNFSEYIVFSESIINSFEEDDLLLEIITTDLFLNSIPETSLFYCSDPVPLSRVKQIHFKSTTAKHTFLSSAKAFPDSFIPEEICFIVSEKIPTSQIELSKIELPHNPDLETWKIKLGKFDKIMGMFAFMKNAGIFYTEKENLYQEYSPNYFTLLSIINPCLVLPSTNDLGLFKSILFPFDIEVVNVQRQLFRQILDIIHTDKNFDLTLAQNIIKGVLESNLANADEVKELFLILDYFIKLDKRQISYKELLSLDIIRRNHPVLALLFLSRFSNKSRTHTDKQAVRNMFISHEANFSRGMSEYLLGMLGLYYGYKTMIKEDTNIKVSDGAFLPIVERQQSIKFRILSRLEKVTIESIFSFCKTDVAATQDFPFLDSQISNRIPINQLAKGRKFEYFDRSYEVLNTVITVIERRNVSDKIVEIIERAYPEKISVSSSLLHYILSINGISKRSFLEIIRQNVDRLDFDEVQNLIDIDKHSKNNRL